MTTKLIRRCATARFETRSDPSVGENSLAWINRLIPAGEPAVTPDDVHIRHALICNDQVDHYSTRFTLEALQEIVTLINENPNGVNLMRNHDEWSLEALPVGRLYYAELVLIGTVTHVRAYFYWAKGTSDGDDMARQFALGIWREVSVSWWMKSFTNSIDGKPMSESPYYAGQEMPDGTVIIGIMSQIVEVNELSIVSRGGQKDTSVGPARSNREASEMDTVEGLIAGARSRAQRSAAQSSTPDYWRDRRASDAKSASGNAPAWFTNASGSG